MILNGSPRGPRTGVHFRARCAAGGESGELFGGCLPAEGLAGAGVEFRGDRGDPLGAVDAQIGALRKILPQQSVGVLVARSLPRPAPTTGRPSAPWSNGAAGSRSCCTYPTGATPPTWSETPSSRPSPSCRPPCAAPWVPVVVATPSVLRELRWTRSRHGKVAQGRSRFPRNVSSTVS